METKILKPLNSHKKFFEEKSGQEKILEVRKKFSYKKISRAENFPEKIFTNKISETKIFLTKTYLSENSQKKFLESKYLKKFL